LDHDEADGFEALRGERYLSLTTFRRNGERVATPVWFALRDGPVAYVTTDADAGKVKRLRHDTACTVAPCDVRGRVRGPEIAAVARLLDGQDAEVAREALANTYGWQWRLVGLSATMGRLIGRHRVGRVELALRPAATGDEDEQPARADRRVHQ
jgi:uncharacterized protein